MSWGRVLEVVFGWADTGFGLTKEQRKVKIRVKIDKLEREDRKLAREPKTKKALKRRQTIAFKLGTLYNRVLNLE